MLREEVQSQILLNSSEFYLYAMFMLSSAVKEVQETPKSIYNIAVIFGLLLNKAKFNTKTLRVNSNILLIIKT